MLDSRLRVHPIMLVEMPREDKVPVGNRLGAATWARLDKGHANGGPVRRLGREEIARIYGADSLPPAPAPNRFGPKASPRR